MGASDDIRQIDATVCKSRFVDYAGGRFLAVCFLSLIEVIQELRDYLGPEADGLTDEDVVHRVMCKALEYQAELSTLKSKEPPRPEPPHRYGQR